MSEPADAPRTRSETSPAVPVSERRIVAGGATYHVVEAGSGPPVLLLHGFPDNWRLWRHQLDALVPAGRRVIAPDLLGFGESDRPAETERYAMSLLARDVLALLDASEVERCAVVGHDWGAALAWALAAFAPERVERLAAVSVGHPGAFATAGIGQRMRSWYMLWFLFPGVAEKALPAGDFAFWRRWAWGGVSPGEDPDADRQIADLSRPGALGAALNWYRANIAPERFHLDSPQRNLPPIRCRTMGVWSSGDGALSEEQMTGSAEYVEGTWRYERIEGVDHWVPVHAPDTLSALLLDFLGGPAA
jgi:pimeloyl-ACP methyl ester carboxylesterase